MTNDYRIEPAGTAFRVLDPWVEYLVDLFPTREAAQRDIERCKREDEMYETAQQLVDIALLVRFTMSAIDRLEKSLPKEEGYTPFESSNPSSG